MVLGGTFLAGRQPDKEHLVRSLSKIKITGKTPEVRSDKRKEIEERRYGHLKLPGGTSQNLHGNFWLC